MFRFRLLLRRCALKKGLLTAAVLLLIALPFAHAAEGKVRLAIVGLDHDHVWGLLKVETYMFVSGTKGCRRERRWPSVLLPGCLDISRSVSCILLAWCVTRVRD